MQIHSHTHTYEWWMYANNTPTYHTLNNKKSIAKCNNNCLPPQWQQWRQQKQRQWCRKEAIMTEQQLLAKAIATAPISVISLFQTTTIAKSCSGRLQSLRSNGMQHVTAQEVCKLSERVSNWVHERLVSDDSIASCKRKQQTPAAKSCNRA